MISFSDKQIKYVALIGVIITLLLVSSAHLGQVDVKIRFLNYSRTNNQVMATIQLRNIGYSDVILTPYLTLYSTDESGVAKVEFVRFMENHRILAAESNNDIAFAFPPNIKSWQAGFGYSPRPPTMV